MNERIKEFARQCGATQGFPFQVNGKWSNRELHTDAIDLEKFAELIVEECIQQVQKDHFGGRESWDRALDNATRNIKNHFGVE